MDALRGATVTLGFSDVKYALLVNETSFDNLPEFKEKVELPEVAHSITETHNGPSIHRVDFRVLLRGRRTPVSIQHNLRSG